MSEIQTLRLKYIYVGDFRKNEATLMEEVLKEVKDLQLGANDCVLMLSSAKKVLRFIFGFIDGAVYSTATGIVRDFTLKVLPSRTFRIIGGGEWNPLMLQNYAEQIGIKFAQIKRFEEHMKALIDARDADEAAHTPKKKPRAQSETKPRRSFSRSRADRQASLQLG